VRAELASTARWNSSLPARVGGQCEDVIPGSPRFHLRRKSPFVLRVLSLVPGFRNVVDRWHSDLSMVILHLEYPPRPRKWADSGAQRPCATCSAPNPSFGHLFGHKATLQPFCVLEDSGLQGSGLPNRGLTDFRLSDLAICSHMGPRQPTWAHPRSVPRSLPRSR